MALRYILTEEDPSLRKKSREIGEVTDRIRILLDDMVETMRDADGVGLAAPQVGVLRRAVVVEVGQLYEMIDPVIVGTDGEQFNEEACLSVPGMAGKVHRPQRVTVEYTDREGSRQRAEAEGLEAVAFCHEIDHLDGVLYTDRAELLRRSDEAYEGEDGAEEGDAEQAPQEERKGQASQKRQEAQERTE